MRLLTSKLPFVLAIQSIAAVCVTDDDCHPMAVCTGSGTTGCECNSGFSGDGLTCLFDFRRWAVSSSFLFDFNAKFAIGRLFVTLCIPVGSLSRGILLEVSMYALR